ncbi:hypothetical protein M885DRAFT_544132 [Pelagophyceae sp. CCMP2097]|nr:hypothetical protein M885DRAFT_544132 [Pelagophyceae sp. CCMP2097]|mmetsp:Transcript_18011/g.60754  ORF Transcript_18011/g.60754 Transcript_18011/m.60754 type:complete len:256 (-) Transcript_18011:74-841(-)
MLLARPPMPRRCCPRGCHNAKQSAGRMVAVERVRDAADGFGGVGGAEVQLPEARRRRRGDVGRRRCAAHVGDTHWVRVKAEVAEAVDGLEAVGRCRLRRGLGGGVGAVDAEERRGLNGHSGRRLRGFGAKRRLCGFARRPRSGGVAAGVERGIVVRVVGVAQERSASERETAKRRRAELGGRPSRALEGGRPRLGEQRKGGEGGAGPRVGVRPPAVGGRRLGRLGRRRRRWRGGRRWAVVGVVKLRRHVESEGPE